MKSLWVILLLYLMAPLVHGQDSISTKKIAEQVYCVAIDPLHQIYYINAQKQLVKLSSLQEKEYVYSDLMIDDQTQIITQNPFKIILFKKDIGDIIVLDNRLNVTVKTNLFDLGYFSVSGLTFSIDNQYIWIFDVERQQLVKLDQQYKPVYHSNNLTQVLSQKIQPHQLLVFENSIYLLDQNSGIYLFDNVGNYSKKIPILHAEKMWVIANKIYFFREGQIWFYDPLLFEEMPFYSLPRYEQVELTRNFILGISKDKELHQFHWKK